MGSRAEEALNIKHRAVLDLFEKNGLHLLSSFVGGLSQEKVNDIVFATEEYLKGKGVKKGIIKRIFSALIEALQNLRLHGENDSEGEKLCYEVLGVQDDLIHMNTGNIVFNSNIEKIKERIDYINDLLANGGLKEYYMNVLTDGKISDKGGAGLGFITIIMKAKNKLDYEFIDIGNDRSVFVMDSKISLIKKEE